MVQPQKLKFLPVQLLILLQMVIFRLNSGTKEPVLQAHLKLLIGRYMAQGYWYIVRMIMVKLHLKCPMEVLTSTYLWQCNY